jgi:hypothetical protein
VVMVVKEPAVKRGGAEGGLDGIEIHRGDDTRGGVGESRWYSDPRSQNRDLHPTD